MMRLLAWVIGMCVFVVPLHAFAQQSGVACVPNKSALCADDAHGVGRKIRVVDDIVTDFDQKNHVVRMRNVYRYVSTKTVARGKKFELVIDRDDVHARNIPQARWDFVLHQLETVVYPLITNNFYTESDVDGNGKIVIFFGDLPSHLAGYIQRSDLCMTCDSNRGEYVYVRIGHSLDDEDVATIGHELVHLVATNPMLRSGSFPIWFEEMMGEVAEDMVLRETRGNRAADKEVARSFIKARPMLSHAPFFVHNGVLSFRSEMYMAMYTKWGLFGQYVRARFAMRKAMFPEVRPFRQLITARSVDAVKNMEALFQKYIDPTMTFGRFLTQFYVAMVTGTDAAGYLLDSSIFQTLRYPIHSTWQKMLLPGNAFVVRATKPIAKPVTAGPNIRYTFVPEKKVLIVTNEATEPHKIEPTM